MMGVWDSTAARLPIRLPAASQAFSNAGYGANVAVLYLAQASW